MGIRPDSEFAFDVPDIMFEQRSFSEGEARVERSVGNSEEITKAALAKCCR